MSTVTVTVTVTGLNVNGYPGSEAKFSCLDGFVVSQDLNDYLKDFNFALDISKNVKPIQSRPGKITTRIPF